MTGETKVMVEMTEREQELFLAFCQYFPSIKIMIESELFLIRTGNAELHFDNGQLMDIFITKHPYKRPKREINIALQSRI